MKIYKKPDNFFDGWLYWDFNNIKSNQLININVEIKNYSILVAFLGAIFTALAYVTVKNFHIKRMFL